MNAVKERLQILTLGCSKNRVDSEHLLSLLSPHYAIVPEDEWGSDEAAEGLVSVKDMVTGTQEKLTPAAAAEKINAALARRRTAKPIR